MTAARDRILLIAERLLRAEGLGAVTTRRVAAKAGITPMALYHHFGDKEGLVEALVSTGFQHWEARLAVAVSTGAPAERVRRVIDAYRQFALDEPRYFELMFLLPRPAVPRAPQSLGSTSSPSFARAIEAVAEAMKAGVFPAADPRQFILLIWATAHGLIALHFSGRFGHDATAFREAFDGAITMLLARLRAS